MHELPVVIDIVRIMDEESKKHGFNKITRINLVIGELSAIMDESVQMYFEVIAEKSTCAGAKLSFEHVPAMLKCLECGVQFPHAKSFDCPYCGGDSVLVKGTGREFYIKSYEGSDKAPSE
jgi:hydrogenase nickel incorporation protein HypA/HybF